MRVAVVLLTRTEPALPTADERLWSISERQARLDCKGAEGRVAMNESVLTDKTLSAEKSFGMKIFGGLVNTTGGFGC